MRPPQDPRSITLHGLAALAQAFGPALRLSHLVDAGLDRIPVPARGATRVRWSMLAAVGALDLSLAKLYEGHTDALAILEELDGPEANAGSRWGTWCAEPPDARLAMRSSTDGDPRALWLEGRKAWCSGAAEATHAIVSGWNEKGEPWLAAVDLAQPEIEITTEGWPAVGMADSRSVDVHFHGAKAIAVGNPGDYTRRPGFWQGGAGIAACWLGAAAAIASAVQRRSSESSDPHRLAHLGAIDVAIQPAFALMREAAAWIDANPRADAQAVALGARLAVECTADEVLRHAGRALGAGPLCRDPWLARAMADLPIYLRQSHAERDLQQLGKLRCAQAERGEALPWML